MSMKGIVPSLNTPFLEDGSVDYTSLRKLVDHTVEAGCGGMLGLAVAGEHAVLSLDEKARYVETVADANAGRIPFVVSVTASEVADSLALVRMANAVKTAGVCVQLPPGLGRQGNLSFLQDIAEQSPGLVMVQDLDWTGGGLALEEIVSLYHAVEKFTWLKIETQQAGPKYSAVLSATGGTLNVCGGWAVTQLMDAMARGVTAFIPTGMERVYVAIHMMYERGDRDGARALFERVLPILNFSNQHINTSIRFFKELRKAEGMFETATCRTATATFDAVQQIEAKHATRSALTLIDEMKRYPELSESRRA